MGEYLLVLHALVKCSQNASAMFFTQVDEHLRQITTAKLPVSCFIGHMHLCSPLRPLLQKTAMSSPWTQLCPPIPLWVQERRVEEEREQEISSSQIGPVPAENLTSINGMHINGDKI